MLLCPRSTMNKAIYKLLMPLLLCGTVVHANPITRDYIYDVDVVSVYDGDTLNVDIDLGFSIWIRDKSLRLYGIDTPEVRGQTREQGLAVRDWLRQRIDQGENILIQSISDQPDKYGRYLAILYIDGVNINRLLIDEGLARPYNP